MIPNYLTMPRLDGPTYGYLHWSDGYYEIRNAGPAVLEMAKRLFPGSRVRHREKEVRFRATRRVMGDLLWFMQRYPLRIDDVERFKALREPAVGHAVRTEEHGNKLPRVPNPPAFDGELATHQAEGVAFFEQNDRALNADEMGLGKTVQAIAAMAHCDAFPVLICAPPNLRTQWQEQIGRFLNMKADGCLVRDTSGAGLCEMLVGMTDRKIEGKPIAITSYNLLPYWKDAILARGFRTFIIDEVQELRHTGTLKYSAASEISSAVDRVWGLSGTPIHNYGDEMWSVLNIIDYHCLGDFDSFTREWCDGYGSRIVTKTEALRDHLRREGLMLRRRKREVDHELPPKHRVLHSIDHDRGVYAELMRSTVALVGQLQRTQTWHERGRLATEIDRSTRLATGLAKVHEVSAFVEGLLRAGERPLIYAWHHEVHERIVEALSGFRIGLITGKQSQSAKHSAIKAFEKRELDGMLLSLRSTAGLDGLQYAATCVVFAELDWSPAIHSQCEDRLHRFGIHAGIDKVICYYLHAATGSDQTIMDALGIKVGQFKGIMGDAAETQADRDLAEQAARDHLDRVVASISRELASEPQRSLCLCGEDSQP